MYTALSLGVRLNDCLSDEVVDVLKYMVYDKQEAGALHYAKTNAHPFFNAPRWECMLRYTTYFFDWQTNYEFYHKEILGYCLNGFSSLKCYDNEINLFLDWLCPMISTNGFIGWKMYEDDDTPTILFKENGKIIERGCNER